MGEVHEGIVGPYILPALEEARSSIDVVSPYLSPKYAELLLSKAKSGVRVRLITSASNEEALAVLRRIQPDSDRSFHYGLLFVAIALFCGFAYLFLIDQRWAYACIGSLLVFILLLIRRQRKQPLGKETTPPLSVKVPAKEFIHAKLYIIDRRVAITGSANLTYSAMKRNIEHVEVKSSPQEVREVAQSFSRLWGLHGDGTREYEEEEKVERPYAGTGTEHEEETEEKPQKKHHRLKWYAYWAVGLLLLVWCIYLFFIVK